MNKRKVQEINASSMADIAFLLLIFFLVTTTMSVDKGLSRRLPSIPESEEQKKDQKVNDRDIFEVLINSQNQLLVEGQPLDVKELRSKTKEFILNKGNQDNMPLLTPVEFEIDGKKEKINVTQKHVVSLQTDRGTEYQKYLEVQNELVAAYNEIREEFAKSRFGMPYSELSLERQEVIQEIYPQKISEAEPKVYGGKK